MKIPETEKAAAARLRQVTAQMDNLADEIERVGDDRDALIVALHDDHGWSLRKIAVETGRSESATHRAYVRAAGLVRG